MHQKNKKVIAVFGGSFNPVTRGHIHTANQVIEWIDIDELWFVPCCTHAHGKKLEDCVHRIKMLDAALETEDKKIKVNDIECRLNMSGRSKDLLDVLKIEYPDDDFYIVIGQDVANNFDKFYAYEYLQQNAKFIVVPRAGYETAIENQWYTEGPHIYLYGMTTTKLSSTLVRETIKDKKYNELFAQVPLQVISYVLENKLYEK